MSCRPDSARAQPSPWLVLLLGLLTATGGCKRKQASNDTSCERFRQRGQIVIFLREEPPHLCDLLKDSYWIHQITLNNLMETLIREDPRTGELKPGLATKWSLSKDLTLTLWLRKGVRFHDGKPFTADDVIFTVATILDTTFPNRARRSAFSYISSYRKLDSHTVAFKLKSVDAFTFLNMASDLQIYPKHLFKRGIKTVCGERRLVGTGPYRLDSWRDGRITLQRFDNYWGKKPAVKRIVFRKVDESKILLALKRGDLDLTTELASQRVVAFRKSKALLRQRYVLRQFPGNTYTMLGFNHKRPQFADKRVRVAITHLVDLERVRKGLFHGEATYAIGPFHRLSKATPTRKPLGYAPKKALALLASAGWKTKDAGGVLTKAGARMVLRLLYRAQSKQQRQLAAHLADHLQRFGITIVPTPLVWGKLLAAVPKGDYDLFLFSWGPIPMHYDLYPFFHSKGELNWIFYRDASVDADLEKARTLHNSDQRLALYRQLADKLYREQVVQFQFIPTQAVVANRCIGGIFPSALGLQFHSLTFSPK